jgi:gluconokinase
MSMAASRPACDGRSGLGPVIVMGVSGCGKSSAGHRIAQYMGCRFAEGDSLHSPENVEKMRNGIALDDVDRLPWLEAIGQLLAADGDIVISCSALKKTYRDRLRAGARRPVTFVFLQGSRTLLSARLDERHEHYMPAFLLDSQLAILELPVRETDVITIEIDQPLERIVGLALSALAARARRRRQIALS